VPYKIKIDRDVNCVFVRHYDTFESGEDLLQLNELLQHPDYEKNLNLLRDVSELSLPEDYDLDFFRKNVNESMSRTEGKLGSGRNVAWVLNNAHDFKIVHQWTAIARLNLQVIERRPFRDIRAARTWLKIPENYEIMYPN
jgi:hypothetical protein